MVIFILGFHRCMLVPSRKTDDDRVRRGAGFGASSESHYCAGSRGQEVSSTEQGRVGVGVRLVVVFVVVGSNGTLGGSRS